VVTHGPENRVGRKPLAPGASPPRGTLWCNVTVRKTTLRASDISTKSIALLWSRIERRGPDECWSWTGETYVGGYGLFHVGDRVVGAHAAVFALADGEVPAGFLVRHSTCGNPPCCNRRHMALGDDADNVRDREKDGRTVRGDKHWSRISPEKRPRGEANGKRIHPESCARGDDNGSRKSPELLARGEKHPLAKLTAVTVQQMRARHAAGETFASLGRAFGISDVAAGLVCKGITWAHVGGI